MNLYLVLHLFLCASYIISLHVYFKKTGKLDKKYLNTMSEINKEYLQEVTEATSKQIIYFHKEIINIKRELKNKTEEKS